MLESSLYVNDLEEGTAFYRDILGLKLHSMDDSRHAFFHCGNNMILLFLAEQSLKPDQSTPPHGSHGSGHLALNIEQEAIIDWKARLKQHGVEIERELTWPNGAVSLYFRDPSGNSLELASGSIWKSS